MAADPVTGTTTGNVTVILEGGPQEFGEKQLRDEAGLIFYFHEPSTITAGGQEIEMISRNALTDDEHHILFVAGYDPVFIPGKGECFVRQESRTAVDAYVANELAAQSRAFSDLIDPFPPSTDHLPHDDAHARAVAEKLWPRLPQSTLRSKDGEIELTVVKNSDLKPGQTDLLLIANYEQWKASDIAIALEIPCDFAKPDETIWVHP
ncbi:MAG: hypothetical protein HYT76_06735 [Deltaproteobacteria bacterium]|nr:hypothetical protein [Deltaproteobacteria bacterium]